MTARKKGGRQCGYRHLIGSGLDDDGTETLPRQRHAQALRHDRMELQDLGEEVQRRQRSGGDDHRSELLEDGSHRDGGVQTGQLQNGLRTVDRPLVVRLDDDLEPLGVGADQRAEIRYQPDGQVVVRVVDLQRVDQRVQSVVTEPGEASRVEPFRTGDGIACLRDFLSMPLSGGMRRMKESGPSASTSSTSSRVHR